MRKPYNKEGVCPLLFWRLVRPSFKEADSLKINMCSVKTDLRKRNVFIYSQQQLPFVWCHFFSFFIYSFLYLSLIYGQFWPSFSLSLSPSLSPCDSPPRACSSRREIRAPRHLSPDHHAGASYFSQLPPGNDDFWLPIQVEVPQIFADVFPIEPVTLSPSVQIENTKIFQSISIMQFPMNCADAITVHKLQGTTLDTNLYVHSVQGLQAAYTIFMHTRTFGQIFLLNPLESNKVLKWTLPDGLEIESQHLNSSSDIIVPKMMSLF